MRPEATESNMENRMQEGCAIIDELIAIAAAWKTEPCTECGKPSGGNRCCMESLKQSHALCEDCAVIAEDGYHYCRSHLQDARDEIAEREVYAALATLSNVCGVRGAQAYRCKELIDNLGRLARFHMNELKGKEDR